MGFVRSDLFARRTVEGDLLRKLRQIAPIEVNTIRNRQDVVLKPMLGSGGARCDRCGGQTPGGGGTPLLQFLWRSATQDHLGLNGRDSSRMFGGGVAFAGKGRDI
jgi:hypothetical protein